MAVSKRTYRGPAGQFLSPLADAFNKLRPRSAALESTREGESLLFVAGWTDWEAAAIYTLVAGGVPYPMISERVVAGKVAELMHGAETTGEKKPRSEWVGEVLMSDSGALASIAPPEFAAGASSRQEPQEGPSEDADAPYEDDEGNPSAPPPGWENAVLNTLFKNADAPPPEPPQEIPIPIPDHGGPLKEDERRIEVRVTMRDPKGKGPGDEALLLSAAEVEVTLRLEGDSFKLVKLLSVVGDASIGETVERLLEERLEHYRNPMVLAFMTGASEN